MLATVEEQLQERNDPHFLTKISHLLCDCWEPRKIVLMFFNSVLELHNFSMSQRCKQLIEPFKFSSNQALKDLLIKLQIWLDLEQTYQFCDVKNMSSKKYCHPHFSCPLFVLINS
jgi:hypothetical protein